MNNYKDTGRVYTLKDLFDLGLKVEIGDTCITLSGKHCEIRKYLFCINSPSDIDGSIALVSSKQLDEYLEKQAMNNDNIAVTEQEEEAFNAVKTCVKDWKRGDMCVYKNYPAIVVGWHPHHPVVVVDSDEFGLTGAALNELTEAGTQEQKTEREQTSDIEDVKTLLRELLKEVKFINFNKGK